MLITRRVMVGAGVALGAVAFAAAPAFAHASFEPDTGAAGKTAPVTLTAANEQENSAIVRVQLSFPDDEKITLAALPPTPGWTSTVEGGTVGGAVSSVTWSRRSGSASEDVEVALTLGPLPASNAQLLFPTLVTYANGYVDEWVQLSPDADMPASEFDVTGGGPTTTVPPSSAESGSNLLVRGGLGLLIVVAIGAAGFVILRRRRA